MIAVSLFDYTGTMLKPWLEAGFDCHIFDIQHPPGITVREDGMILHGTDLSTLPHGELLQIMEDGDVAFASFFVPCTHVAISGARWFKGKGLRKLAESINMFSVAVEAAELLGCPYMLEQPMSVLSSYWREPDYKFHPSHYAPYADDPKGDFYTKQTWLWTDTAFVMPAREVYDDDLFGKPDDKYIHHQAPGEERANIRSATPQGFARAVFLANAKEHNGEQAKEMSNM
jgi:hypothetical protein